MSNRGHKFEIFPDSDQQQVLASWFGCCRFVWNTFLPQIHKFSWIDLKVWLPFYKADLPWLAECPSQSLQTSLGNLGQAQTRFITGLANKPKKKRKHDKQSLTVQQGCAVIPPAEIDDFTQLSTKQLKQQPLLGGLKLPNLAAPIPLRLHRKIIGVIKSLTVGKTRLGRYYVSILTERTAANGADWSLEERVEYLEWRQTLQLPETGLDTGLSNYIALADGTTVKAPRFYRQSMARLAALQRKLARQMYGKDADGVWQQSKATLKTLTKIRELHAMIARQRADFIHKLTRKLARENQAIAIEGRSYTGGLGKGGRLSARDAAFGLFIALLTYKCAEEGTTLTVLDQWVKTTGVCPVTLRPHPHRIRLSDRTWTCQCCGILHDRDVAAAQVLLAYARLLADLGKDEVKIPGQGVIRLKRVNAPTKTVRLTAMAGRRVKHACTEAEPLSC